LDRVLVVYSWDRVWSMGPGRGSPDFSLSLEALAARFKRVVLVHPAGTGGLAGELPEGIETRVFRWPGGGWNIGVPPAIRGASPAARGLRAAVFALNWALRLFSFLWFTAAAYRAGRTVAAELRPDLVAAYGCLAAPAGRLISRALGVPLAVRLFGVSLGMRGFSPLVRLAQFEETLAFRVNAARWVITDDGSGGAEAARWLGVPSCRIVSLLCGVERTRPDLPVDRESYRVRLGLAPGTRVVLRVSRLWRQQRVDRLIRALPDCLADNTPVAAVIVGEGPERQYLERLARDLGRRVVFTGALSRGALPEHYLCADLYAATADRTNLSHSVLEAMCCGLTVLALDTGRTSDLVADGMNGVLVESGREDLLRRALIDLLADPARLKTLAAGALRTAEMRIPDPGTRRLKEAAAMSLEPVPVTFLEER
jgi:glycosyltransferase involved in cell wall biosynthesis